MADIPDAAPKDTPSGQEEAPPEERLTPEFWESEIAASESGTRSFRIAGQHVLKQYMGGHEAGEEAALDDDVSQSRYNLFTVNVNIMLAVLYGRQPVPTVDRKHGDALDDVARCAATMLERCLLVDKRSDFDVAVRQAVFDRLTPGLGQLWMRYCPDIQKCKTAEVRAQDGTVLAAPMEYERVTNERVVADYVYWSDFLWQQSRTWGEVGWCGRRIWMRRADVEERWGAEIAEQLMYGTMKSSDRSSTGLKDRTKYAQVYEIWDKIKKRVVWYSRGVGQLLEAQDDPLRLCDFFPCPPPLLATHTTSNIVPRSDYALAKSQYEELNVLNSRIYLLVKAVRVAGVYDKMAEPLKKLLQPGSENIMIPVDNWAMFAEKGGIKGVVDWFPLDQVIQAIERLRTYRQDLIQQLYELTGIADIMRGGTKASETLGAQEMKAQFASVRLQFVQGDIAAFIEAALVIKYEIMARRFADESWIKQSNFENTYDAQTPEGQAAIDRAVQLLRDPYKAKLRVNVSTDSLSVPDFNSERDARILFIRGIGAFIEQTTPLMQAQPGAAPYVLKLIQWAAAGFRVGKTVESVLDEAIKAVEKKLMEPPPPPPEDPSVTTEKIKQQGEIAKQQGEQQTRTMDMQATQMEHALDAKKDMREEALDQAVFQRKMAGIMMDRLVPKPQQATGVTNSGKAE